MRSGQPLRAATARLGFETALRMQEAGLRERKKVQTRLHISDTATALFLERGFDAVTVAEVAAVAGVSVKTVFNYFGSKEELLFDREPELVASIDALAARERPGVGLIRVLQADVAVRWPAVDFGRWELLTKEAAADRRRFYRLVAAHPALQARWLLMTERMGDRFTVAVGGHFDDPNSPEAVTAATLIHSAYALTGKEYVSHLLAGDHSEAIAARARAVGLHALDVVERAYAGTSLVEGRP